MLLKIEGSYDQFLQLFKLFILIVYVWFAVGIAVISVFAIRELFSWFKVPNEHISQSIQKGPRKNYEM